MKNSNWSLFFGCCIISIGIVIAGYIISANLPGTTHIPNNFGIYYMDESITTPDFQEYMSDFEVSVLLMMSTDEFSAYINTGALDGTFTTIQERRIFSREKIIQWLNDIIEAK